MRSDAIRPGDVIGGQYRVRAILSRTRGFLVEAFHTEFDQRVVVRILSPALCDEKEVDRFRREARTLAKLQSEHVARILDVGTLPDGAFFFARPYLEGVDLAAHLKKRGAMQLGEAVGLILQVSEALAETHTYNIILREMQPSHLFLAQRLGGGTALKLIDFGTAKLLRDAAAPGLGGEMTATSMFGLSCYSSPELVRKAKHVDIRTDVWSLGAILYQMLAGRPPFDGEMAALMLQISRDDPAPLARSRRDLPPEIDQIIGWAMAKDPDGRFASVHAFAHALTPFASPEGLVLIQRIGEITNAAKQHRKQPAVDREHPITMDGEELLELDDADDDQPTMVHTDYLAPMPVPGGKPLPAAGGPQHTQTQAMPQQRAQPTPQARPQPAAAPPPAAEADAPFDRTMFIGADFVPPSPTAGGGQSPPAPARPAPGAMPMFGGAAMGMQVQPPPPLQQQAAPSSLLGPSMDLDGNRASVAAWSSGPGSSPNGVAAGSGMPAAIPRAALQTVLGGPKVKPAPAGQKIALIAVGGAVVVLSAIAALVIIKGRPSVETPVGSEAALASSAPLTIAAASSAPTAGAIAVNDPPPPSTTDTVASPSATPSVQVAINDPQASTGTRAAGPLPTAKAAGGKSTGTVVTPPPPPPPPPAGGGDMGTIVAVAVGGTCAFSVNGASKGTMSTLKLQVKPGSYSVTCKPSTGATKSKSVTVAGGGSAMAMFKLQ
jgi:eukaryotic-like serine/threonine-protein kinase